MMRGSGHTGLAGAAAVAGEEVTEDTRSEKVGGPVTEWAVTQRFTVPPQALIRTAGAPPSSHFHGLGDNFGPCEPFPFS
jgi:hypothetical protein